MALAGKILAAISGIAWSIAYIDMIRLGLRDKTYGMPFVAMAAFYADDAVNHQVANAPVRGQAAIQAMFEKEFARPDDLYRRKPLRGRRIGHLGMERSPGPQGLRLLLRAEG